MPRGRRAATCSRARWAICRTAACDSADGLGDLGVLEGEDLAQHEHGPLGRGEGLQDQQHRRREAVGQGDVLGDVGRGQQGFRQPRAEIGLLAAAEDAELPESLAGGDGDQVGALVADLGEVHAGPLQPGLLDDVLGVGGRAEQLVGDGEEQGAVGDERLRRGIGHIHQMSEPTVS